MSDAYGAIICANQSSGDPEAIVKALNRFFWNDDMEPFKLIDGDIYVDGQVQYPTVIPHKKVIVDEDTDEAIIIDDEEKLTEDELDEIEIGDEVELEDLVRAIAPVLKTGEITVFINSSQRDYYLASGFLTIRSDMTAVCRYASASPRFFNAGETETYP